MNDPNTVRKLSSFQIFCTSIFALIVASLFGIASKYIYIPNKSGIIDEEFGATRKDLRKKIEKEQNFNATHYGWTDRKKRVVRIPIERAIELSAQELKKR